MITCSSIYSGVTPEELQKNQPIVKTTIDTFTDVLDDEYHTPYGFINLPFDQSISEQVQGCIDRKKEYDPRLCIVVGIGGSSLGTRAVYQALIGRLDKHTTRMQLYCIDTIDSMYLADLCMRLERAINDKQSVVVNVVSKSGMTLETLANFQVIANCVKRYCPQAYRDTLVITTDQGSPLWEWGVQEGIDLLPIPASVGGRFSVFSAVSLFPLGLVGINIDQLLDGARSITSDCMRDDENNHAAHMALIFYKWYTKGLPILDMFFFAAEFEGIGKWARQLIGESIGKRCDLRGNQVRIGIVPTVSIGSSDLHAIGQRYFGGARTIGTIFYTVEHQCSFLVVPATPLPSSMTGDIVGKDVNTLMHAIAQGTQRAYADQKMPYIHVEIPEINAYYVGQLLQYHMMSIVYLAALLEVDPFDQPEVQRYKKETKELLRNEY